MGYWTVARTAPNRENFAESELDRRGFEVYAPRIAERIARRGRKITVERPLFAGYIFVVIEVGWYDAHWCPGITRLLLSVDGSPAKVPVAVVAGLKARERSGLIVLPRRPPFLPGDRVRVIRGPLAGLSGLYQGQRSHERVAILLAALGRVEIAAGDVAANV
jgi:transcription antitermination factor NusG